MVLGESIRTRVACPTPQKCGIGDSQAALAMGMSSYRL